MKVSIFTPTHDTTFLNDAYASIKGQDFHEWVVLLNNGAGEIKFDDKRVKVCRAPDIAQPWVGPLKRLCCEAATGDVFLELDHDDLLSPNCLHEVKRAFDDPEIGFVYSNTVHSDMAGNPVMRFDEKYGWTYRQRDDGLDEHIHFEPSPSCVSRIWFAPNHVRAFRRKAYEAVGGYSKDMRILDDLDLMCRLYCATKFKHVNEGLYIYRVHGQNTWLVHNKEIQDNVYRIYDKYIWHLVKSWCDQNGLLKIDLGGAFRPEPGYITVDMFDADVICDLNERWPFEDDSVGCIRAVDIFEHLQDPLHVMKECYRVLAPGGWVMACIPSTEGRGAFQDPTHKSYWNENSFWYWTKKEHAQYIRTPVRFQATRLYTDPPNQNKIAFTTAHMISLKNGYRPPGLIEI